MKKREYKQIAQFQQIGKFKEWYNAEISAEKWARKNKHVRQQFYTEYFNCRFAQNGNNCPVRLMIKHNMKIGEVSVEQSGEHEHDHKEQEKQIKASSARKICERIWKCRESGMSLDEIAAKFEMTPSIVKIHLARYKKKNGLSRKKEEAASSFSQIRNERIWKCRESGMSLDEIAAKFGMTPNIVKSKLDYYKQLNGLTRKKQESARQLREQLWRCKESGMSIDEIADKFEMAPGSVKGRLDLYKRQNGLARNQEELYSSASQLREQLWRCRESGMSIKEIAAKFEMKPRGVEYRLAHYKKQNGIVHQNSKESTSAQRKVASANRNPPSEIVEETLVLYEDGESINKIVRNPEHKIKSVCKKDLDRAIINRLDFGGNCEDSSSLDSHDDDDGEDQNKVEDKDKHLHPTEQHMNHYKKLNGLSRKKEELYSSSREIREQIWKCRESGMSVEETAAKFNKTKNSIKCLCYKYRKQNGIVNNPEHEIRSVCKEARAQQDLDLDRAINRLDSEDSSSSSDSSDDDGEDQENNVEDDHLHPTEHDDDHQSETCDFIKGQEGQAKASSARQINERIWECRESGMSYVEIAAEFDMNPKSVTAKLAYHKQLNGLTRKKEELHSSSRQLREQIWRCKESGMINDEIAAKFNKTKFSIKSHCYKYRKQNGFEIKSVVCKKTRAQNMDRAINRLDFEDSSSNSCDDGDDQNNIEEDERLHHPVEQTQPSTSTLPRKQRTLYSRFHVYQEYSANIYYVCSRNYKIRLFLLKPIIPSIEALLPRTGNELDDEGLSTTPSINKMKKFNALVVSLFFSFEIASFKKNKLDMAHQLYSYDCPDCNFQLVGQPFIPIVYLVIDHFIDCPTHLVGKMVRKLFLKERERFNTFLGANFNHAYVLPKDAQLEFYKWNPYETFHCSLSLADDDDDEEVQLEDGKLPIDRQHSFLSDEEAETENEELDGADEEDNNGIKDSDESDAECSDGPEEEDLEGDDENEPWNWKEKNLFDKFGDLNVPAGYDDYDSL